MDEGVTSVSTEPTVSWNTAHSVAKVTLYCSQVKAQETLIFMFASFMENSRKKINNIKAILSHPNRYV